MSQHGVISLAALARRGCLIFAFCTCTLLRKPPRLSDVWLPHAAQNALQSGLTTTQSRRICSRPTPPASGGKPVPRPCRASYFFTHDEARAAATRRPAAARETGWRWRWWRWPMLADKRAQAALAAGLCVWAGLLHWNISCMCDVGPGALQRLRRGAEGGGFGSLRGLSGCHAVPRGGLAQPRPQSRHCGLLAGCIDALVRLLVSTSWQSSVPF